MALRSRLTGLTAAATLAFAAATLIAVLPGPVAQAASCNSDQAAVTFINGSTHCQDHGSIYYVALRESDKVRHICAGSQVRAYVFPESSTTRPVLPGKCESVSYSIPGIVVRVVPA